MVKPNNLIIKLIGTNFFLNAGWGLIAPIFAIYITEQVQGGSIEMVGFAVGTHWIVKSALQPFIAYKMDVVKGERDDISFLIKGMIMFTVIALLYVFVTAMWQVFLLETIRGIALALVFPAWSGIFTRHIDREWEAYTWSLTSTGMGFAVGFAAAFGGIIASIIGFEMVFVFVALMGAISTAIIYVVQKDPWLQDGPQQEDK